MANLFLSYAREDRECAALLADSLSRHGWTVWWDREIAVGRFFAEVIEKELDQAQCIVVIWSQHAVKSKWVQNEATEAARREVLVPIRIEDTRLPLAFRGLQTADIFDWRNGFAGSDFERCLESIERLVPKTSSESPASHATVQVERQPTEVDPDKVTPPSRFAGAALVSEGAVAPSTQPAAAGFWISQNGEQHCVPDLTTLQAWASEGRLKLDSYVYDRMLQQWIRAYEVPDLQKIYRQSVPNQKSQRTPKLPPSFESKGAVSPAVSAATQPPAERAQQDVETGFWVNQKKVQFRAPDAATLRAWAVEGRVKADSLVHDPERQQWTRADEMPNLRSIYKNREPPPFDSKGAVPPETPTPAQASSGVMQHEQRAVDTGFWIRQKRMQVRVPDRATLQAWAAEGRVQPDSLVHDPELQQWTRANEMPDLRSIYQNRADQKSKQPSMLRRPIIIWGALIGIVMLAVWIATSSRDNADSSTIATHTSATTDTATTEVTKASMAPVLTATDTTETGTTADQTIAVSLQNQCTDKSINVAVAYLNSANQWISTGWYVVPAASTKSRVLTVVGPRIYFYGFSNASEEPWDCLTSDSLCSSLPVKLQTNFALPIEETKGEGITSVRFFGRKVDPKSSTWTQPFLCTN